MSGQAFSAFSLRAASKIYLISGMPFASWLMTTPFGIKVPAKAMLSFHLDKLLEICQFAVSPKQLILQVYTYLQDAHAKDYYQESMAGALWARIGKFSMPSPNGGGGGKPPPNGGGGGNGGGVPEVT
jgi:hypothetical protein